MNVLGIIAGSVACGAVWWAIDKGMRALLFTSMAPLLVGPSTPENYSKVIGYQSLLLQHLIMWICCLYYAWTQEWVYDVQRWSQNLVWTPNDDVEKQIYAPLYIITCGYIIYCIHKESQKTDVKSAGAAGAYSKNFLDFMFLAHHILTLFLSYGSWYYGALRPGFLCNLTVAGTDVILNIGFIYRTRYHANNGSKILCMLISYFLTITWIGTRWISYGWFVLSAQRSVEVIQLPTLDSQVMFWCLIAALWLLYVLQILWGVGIAKAALDVTLS